MFNQFTLSMIAIILLNSGLSLAREKISIGVGQDHPLHLESLAKSVDISQPSILDVSKGETKRTLYLYGKKIGKSNLKILLNNGKSINYSIVVDNGLASLQAQLRNIKAIQMKQNGNRVVIKGNVYSRRDLQVIKKLKRRYPSKILDLTSVNIAEKSTVVKTINRILKENDMPNIQSHAYGKLIALEGSPSDSKQADLAFKIAKMIYPGIENRISKLSNGSPAISIEVIFVETSKSGVKELGFETKAGEFSSDSVPSFGSLSTKPRKGIEPISAMTVNWQVGGLASFIKMLQTRTKSRVLSNPKLVARSGTPAHFHSGKTVYLRGERIEEGKALSTLIPVKDGIQLSITPLIDSLGQIDTKIETSVSQFGDIGKDSVPSISTSTVNTAITIRDGQTILLSGLSKKANHKTVERVPLLADIPVVGELFKKRTHNDQESEMLVLVTINRISAENSRHKAVGSRLWDEAGSDIQFSLFD